MFQKINPFVSVTFICVLFIWILPSMGFLPTLDDYVYNRTLFGVYGTIVAFALVNFLAKVSATKSENLGLSWEQGTFARFVIGLLIGLAIAGIMIFILVITTDYSLVFDADINLSKAMLGLLGFVPLALMEEIVFRGYPFRKMQKVFGLRITQVIMAVLFAYYHDRTGVTLHMQLLGPGIWAFIYGIAAVWSKGIALPTGIHAAVNMVLAILGTKHRDYAIWNFELASSNVEAAESRMSTVGLILQVALLIIGVVLTEWWIRKKMK